MKYTMDDIIRHPIQLVRIQLKDVHVSKYILCEESGEVKREITVSTLAEAVDEKNGFVEATMSVNAFMNDQKYYDAIFTYRGECVNEKENPNDKEFEYFLQVQAIRLLWPYFRETVPGILIKMGTEPFEIPTIDVFETISKNIDKLGAHE